MVLFRLSLVSLGRKYDRRSLDAGQLELEGRYVERCDLLFATGDAPTLDVRRRRAVAIGKVSALAEGC